MFTGMEPFVINHVAGALNSLLKKRELLTRLDLIIEWKPLYELYERLFHTNIESLGLIKLPNNIGQSITSLIKYSRPYFSIDSTEVCFKEIIQKHTPLILYFRKCSKNGGH